MKVTQQRSFLDYFWSYYFYFYFFFEERKRMIKTGSSLSYFSLLSRSGQLQQHPQQRASYFTLMYSFHSNWNRKSKSDYLYYSDVKRMVVSKVSPLTIRWKPSIERSPLCKKRMFFSFHLISLIWFSNFLILKWFRKLLQWIPNTTEWVH
jgi:hypothetical protein